MSENNQNGFYNQNPNNMNNQNDFNSNQYQNTTNNQNDFYSNTTNANGQNNYNNQYQNNMNNQNYYNNQYQNNMNNQNGFNNQYQNNFNMQTSSADFTSCFDFRDIENNKILSAISYIGILFFIPLVAAPNSRFGKFHANQSLLLLISSVLVRILSGAFSLFLNILPWSVYKILKLIPSLLALAIFVAFVYGFVNALSGKAKEIPVIGSIKIIKF